MRNARLRALWFRHLLLDCLFSAPRLRPPLPRSSTSPTVAATTSMWSIRTPRKSQFDHRGIEAAHEIAFSPDGTRVYASNEADHTVDVFEQKTGKLHQEVMLSGRPNNLAVAKDGRIVVAIAQEPGALDIIDPVNSSERSRILTNGRLHNTYVTPDSHYAIMGSTRTNIFTVIDLQKEEIAWELNIGKGVRPMTMEPTRRLDQTGLHAATDLNGFADRRLRLPQMVGKFELPTRRTGRSTSSSTG